MANARKTLAAFVALMVGATNGLGLMSQTVAYADNDSDTPVRYLEQFVGKDVTADMTDEQKMQLIKDSMDPSKVEELNLPDADEEVWVIVELQEESLVQKVVEKIEDGVSSMSVSNYAESDEGQALSRSLLSAQDVVKQEISSCGIKAEYKQSYTAALNGFSARVRYGDIEAIKKLKNVKDVVLSSMYYTDDINEDEESSISPLADTESYDSAKDYDGQYNGAGMVVGIIDTGLDTNHSAFQKAPYKTKMTKEKVSELIPKTLANGATDFSTDDVYVSAKIPYAFDYADVDTDVNPTEESVKNYGNDHGTHVAGITAGNDEEITGVAPESQLMIFKVFSDKSSGAATNDILAGVNDAVVMGVDTINMSLGSSGGFSSEGSDSLITRIYDNVTSAGINLVTSAGNAYSSTYGAADSDYPLTSNPDTGIIGSPSSYSNSLSVASIDATSSKTFKVGDKTIRYNEIAGHEFAKELENTSYEYVMVPGAGLEEDYKDLDVAGKIAVIKRGSATFTAKEEMAAAKGAAGCIIYNNRDGYVISMSVENATIPTISVSKSAGEIMASAENKTITIPEGDSKGNKLMSDFSSWGPLPSLELKPEITGPGGNIYSSLPFGKYGYMSGTSMSSPWVAGATAVVKQYVNSQYPNLSTKEARILVNRLLMSTAVPTTDDRGVLYSPRKQGAGVANIGNAVSTDAYLYVYGQERPKLELGDDKEEKGVYTLSFHLKNMGRSSLSYDLGASTLTESVTVDGKYISQQAYSFDDAKVEIVSISNASLDGKTVTVSGNQDASITMKVTLTEADKEYMKTRFENGIYVEGFVALTAKNEGSVDLSIPYLAFFGDWTKAPMLDSNVFDEKDSVLYDSYPSGIILGNYGMIYSYPLGQYLFALPDGCEEPLPSEDKISIGEAKGNGIDKLGAINLGLLRGAKSINCTLTDKATDKIIFDYTNNNVRKVKYNDSNGEIMPAVAGRYYPSLYSIGKEDNNTEFVYKINSVLDYGDPQNNLNSSWMFPVTVDYEYPILADSDENIVYEGEDGRKYIDIVLADNQYLMACNLYAYTETKDKNGNVIPTIGQAYYNYMKPIYESKPNGQSKITFDITDKYSEFNDGRFFIVTYDYALNQSVYMIKIPVTKVSGITLDKESATMKINETLQLNYSIIPTNASNKKVMWSSSNNDVALVKDGLVTSIGEGETVITATTFDGGYTASCNIKVTSEVSKPILVESVSLNYDKLTLKPGKTQQMRASVSPWYATDKSIKWSSSNLTVAEIDEDGEVLAIQPGTSQIKAEAVGGSYAICELTVQDVPKFEMDGTVLLRYHGVDENVDVPDGVTEIGDYAFNDTSVVNVSLPESVIKIGERAFQDCADLESINIPSKVTVIEEYAFEDCTSLKSIVLPDNIETIEGHTFSYCESMETVKLPKNLKYMGIYAFEDCDSITEIDIPDGFLEFIEDEGTSSAFSGCDSLEKVNLPLTLKKIGIETFDFCESITSIDFKNVEILGERSLEGTGFSTLNIPSSVVKIDEGAFDSCEELEYVNFEGNPDVEKRIFRDCTNLKSVSGNLDIISEEMFSGCESLTEFVIPAGVKKIGDEAFSECENLTKLIFTKEAEFKASLSCFGVDVFRDDDNFLGFVVEEGNKYLSVIDDVLYDKEQKYLIMVTPSKDITELKMADTVENISSSAFYENCSIQNIVFSKNLKEIGAYSFYGCENLVEVILPEGVQTIGDYAFADCYSISKLYFGSSLRNIGEGAFENFDDNDMVKEIILPDTVETIGECAFLGYVAAEKIHVGKNVQTILDETFVNCKSAKVIELPDLIKVIGYKAFYNCNSVEDLILPLGLETIDSRAFYGCYNLNSVDMPDTVRQLGSYAFYRAYGLKSLKLSNNLEELPLQVFGSLNDKYNKYECDQPIKTVNIPASVKMINKNAFANAKYLEKIIVDKDNTNYASTDEGILLSVEDGNILIWPIANTTEEFTIPSTMSRIASSMFMDRMNIRKIVVSGNVNVVENYAFKNSGVEEVIFEDSTNGGLTFGKNVFDGCKSLVNITLPKGLTIMGNYTFNNCSSIEIIELPDTVTDIGRFTFSGDSALKSVKLSQMLTNINEGTFNGCNSLKKLDIPSNVAYIDFNNTVLPFEGCNSLENISVDQYSKFYKSIDGVLYNKQETELIVYPIQKQGEVYCIPEGINRIEKSSFQNNLYLNKILLPSTLQRIGDKAFCGCYNLKNYDFNSLKAPVLEVRTIDGNTKKAWYGNFYDTYFKWDKDNNIYYVDMDLTMTYPEGGVDYDSYLYDIFFASKVEKNIQNMLSVKNLTAVMATDHAVTLTWDAAPWAENYKVERAEITETQIEGTDMATGEARVETTNVYYDYALLGNVTDTTFVDNNTVLGKKYMYKVTPYMDNEATEGVPGTVAIIIYGANDNEKAALEVIRLIDKISDPVTLESEADIIAAREAYDKLTDAQRSYVYNYYKLLEAEKSLKELKIQHMMDGLVKLYGDSRYTTAVEVSKFGWQSSEYAVLASGTSYVDALVSAPIASFYDAPVLLTEGDKLTYETKAELLRLGVNTVFVVGGTGVISDAVQNELSDINIASMRFDGADRFETSLKVAKFLDKVSGDTNTAYVVGGSAEADAVSIASKAAAEKQPIILSGKDSIDEDAMAWLKSRNLKTAYVIGGTSIVSDEVLTSLNGITTEDVSGNRLWGEDRYGTNAAVIERFYKGERENVVVAKGMPVIDALVTAPYAAKTGSPIVLVGDKLFENQKAAIDAMKSSKLTQIGGDVSEDAVNEIIKLLCD